MAKTISITVTEMKLIKKRVKILRHCTLPGWAARLYQCDKCHWAIEEKDMLVLAETEDGILKLHETCYEQGK